MCDIWNSPVQKATGHRVPRLTTLWLCDTCRNVMTLLHVWHEIVICVTYGIVLCIRHLDFMSQSHDALTWHFDRSLTDAEMAGLFYINVSWLLYILWLFTSKCRDSRVMTLYIKVSWLFYINVSWLFYTLSVSTREWESSIMTLWHVDRNQRVMTLVLWKWHVTRVTWHVWYDTLTCVWHDSFTRVTWHWHVTLTSTTWLVYMRDTTPSHLWPWLMHAWRDSLIAGAVAPSTLRFGAKLPIHAALCRRG